MSGECCVTSRKWKKTPQSGLPGLTLEEKQRANEEVRRTIEKNLEKKMDV